MRAGAGGGVTGEDLEAPLADPAALWQVVLQVREVAALSAAAGDGLPQPRAAWSGPAAAAFERARAQCSSRLGTAADVAGAVAAVLARLALALERARAEVARCRRELADVEAERCRRAVLVAAGLPDPGWADLDARVRTLRARHAAAMADYARAMTAAAQALAALYEQVPAAQRGMTAGDRTWQAWRGFGRAFAVEPVQGLWALTGEALVDRRRWADAVEGVPGALLDQVRHPWRTAQQVLGLDAFGHDGGDWTESAGRTAGAMAGVVGGGFGREARLLGRGGRQTLEEMRQGVRLERHEGWGHTLANHVDIDDEGLHRRIAEQLADRSAVVGNLDRSRFASRSSAEELITRALQVNSDAIETWLSSRRASKEFFLDGLSGDDGKILRRSVDGKMRWVAPQRMRVVLARDRHGVFVKTAYLEAS
ncbi:MAG: RNase A-like domain-containing protein [Motilibacteraceae bacterium]